MPIANVRGVSINYEVVGDRGPWLVIIPGGRRAYSEFVPLAHKFAANGYRVLLHDRRNTGASDVAMDRDEVEEITWADDLDILLKQLNASPAFVSGNSSGARTSILFALRHPQSVRALLLMRVTGGAFAAGRLPENYYNQYIRAAEQGGMAAVCATEQYADRIAANAKNREALMAMDPKRFIAIMTRWRDLFTANAHYPVLGVSDAELNSLKVPTIIIPGNDKTHSSASGRAAHRLIPGSVLHELPVTDQDVDIVQFPEWAPHEAEIVRVFTDFMRQVEKRQAA